MSVVRLSVAVVTRSQFENISELAAQRDALPKVISSKSVSFRCKINAGQNEDIKSVENQVLSIYESIARVRASSLGIFDSSFSYLQPTESVRFSAEPNNNLYLIVDKVARQSVERKRAESSSVNNVTTASPSVSKSSTSASSSAVTTPVSAPKNGVLADKTTSASVGPSPKRLKATPSRSAVAAQSSAGSPVTQSTPSKNTSNMNRAARRDAQFRGDLPNLDVPDAEQDRNDLKSDPQAIDETVFDDKSVVKPTPVKKVAPRTRMRKAATTEPKNVETASTAVAESTSTKPKPPAKTTKAKSEPSAEIHGLSTTAEAKSASALAHKAPVKRASQKVTETNSQAAAEPEKKKRAPTTRKSTVPARKSVSLSSEDPEKPEKAVITQSNVMAPITPPNSAPNSAANKPATTVFEETKKTEISTPNTGSSIALDSHTNTHTAPSKIPVPNQVDSSQTMIADNDDIDSGDSDVSDSEDEEERSRRLQRTARARMVSATLRSSSMEPEEIKSAHKDTKHIARQPNEILMKEQTQPAAEPAAAAKTAAKHEPAETINTKNSVSTSVPIQKPESTPGHLPEEDHVPGIGGFESLSKIQPNVHDSKASVQKPRASEPRYESSDEESEDSDDSGDDDSDSESEADETIQKVPRKKTLKHLYG